MLCQPSSRRLALDFLGAALNNTAFVCPPVGSPSSSDCEVTERQWQVNRQEEDSKCGISLKGSVSIWTDPKCRMWVLKGSRDYACKLRLTDHFLQLSTYLWHTRNVVCNASIEQFEKRDKDASELCHRGLKDPLRSRWELFIYLYCLTAGAHCASEEMIDCWYCVTQPAHQCWPIRLPTLDLPLTMWGHSVQRA